MKILEMLRELICLNLRYFFFVMMITPFLALSPYCSIAFSPFNTAIDSMSSGEMSLSKLASVPSIITSGCVSFGAFLSKIFEVVPFSLSRIVISVSVSELVLVREMPLM